MTYYLAQRQSLGNGGRCVLIAGMYAVAYALAADLQNIQSEAVHITY